MSQLHSMMLLVLPSLLLHYLIHPEVFHLQRMLSFVLLSVLMKYVPQHHISQFHSTILLMLLKLVVHTLLYYQLSVPL